MDRPSDGEAIFRGVMDEPEFVLGNVVFVPARGHMGGFSGGAFSDGSFLRTSLLVRTFDDGARVWTSRAAVYAPPVGRARGDFIFGGYLFHHFGHFLLESLSRLALIRRHPGVPVVFLTPRRCFLRWQDEIFGLLGCGNRLVLVGEPTEFERVLFGPPQCVLHAHVARAHVEALAAYEPAPGSSGRDVWLSRTRAGGGGLDNESELEAALAAEGWDIVHPQEHPVAEQIEIVSRARNVAGLDGSAFYTAILSRRVDANLIVVSRRRFIPEIMRRLFDCKGLTPRYLVPEVAYVGGRKAEAVFHLADVAGVLDGIRASMAGCGRG